MTLTTRVSSEHAGGAGRRATAAGGRRLWSRKSDDDCFCRFISTGKCEAEIEKYCKDVDEGDGELADCISDAIAQSENPEMGDDGEQGSSFFEGGCAEGWAVPSQPGGVASAASAPGGPGRRAGGFWQPCMCSSMCRCNALKAACATVHTECDQPFNFWAADDVPDISDACREEVYQYKISRNANINANIPLGG